LITQPRAVDVVLGRGVVGHWQTRHLRDHAALVLRTLKHGVLDSLGLVRPTTRALVLPRLDVPFPTTLQLVTAQTESNLLSQARAEIHRAVPSQERRNTPTVGVKPGFHIDKRLPFL